MLDVLLWPPLVVAMEYGLRLLLACVILVRQHGRPNAAVPWIIVVFAQPFIGGIAYLLVGEVRLGSRRIARHRQIVELIETSNPHQAIRDAQVNRPEIPAEFQPIALLAESVGRTRPHGGNAMRLIGDSDLFIQLLVEAIDAAKHHCHLLTYIYLTDHSGQQVAEALMRAARRSVQCRVLVDAVGSKRFARSSLRRDLQSAGVRVVEALPSNPLRMLFARIDLRNHRKIAIIDGVIGFTGSQNIADAAFAPKKKYAPWVDATVRIEGPVTRDLQVLFIEDWFLDTDEALEELLTIEPPAAPDGVTAQVMGTGPNANNEAMVQLIQTAFHTARKEVVLTTPYFVPDPLTIAAMCTAARRGVATTLVVPARNDSILVGLASRANYDLLLDNGVAIYEYHGGLLHTKTITIDKDLALISTANLDRRSFELNFEVSTVIYDDDLASHLRFLQQSYIDRSTPVDARSWTARRWPARLKQNAAGLLSPLL